MMHFKKNILPELTCQNLTKKYKPDFHCHPLGGRHGREEIEEEGSSLSLGLHRHQKHKAPRCST